MSIVEVDDRFRLTLPKEVRSTFKVSSGERLYVITAGNILIIKKVPEDPSKELDKLIRDVKFDRNARRKAEQWLLSQVRKGS